MSHRTAVLVFPGSNCDSDLFKAAQQTPELAPAYVWYTTASLAGFELILVPGGFSHGDYLRAGALAARSPVVQALRQAGRGTGMALLGSASSSMVGFTIMGFAPMPMFSAFGIITATMVFMAAAAALLVLPSLLMLVTPERRGLD